MRTDSSIFTLHARIDCHGKLCFQLYSNPAIGAEVNFIPQTFLSSLLLNPCSLGVTVSQKFKNIFNIVFNLLFPSRPTEIIKKQYFPCFSLPSPSTSHCRLVWIQQPSQRPLTPPRTLQALPWGMRARPEINSLQWFQLSKHSHRFEGCMVGWWHKTRKRHIHRLHCTMAQGLAALPCKNRRQNGNPKPWPLQQWVG